MLVSGFKASKTGSLHVLPLGMLIFRIQPPSCMETQFTWRSHRWLFWLSWLKFQPIDSTSHRLCKKDIPRDYQVLATESLLVLESYWESSDILEHKLVAPVMSGVLSHRINGYKKIAGFVGGFLPLNNLSSAISILGRVDSVLHSQKQSSYSTHPSLAI